MLSSPLCACLRYCKGTRHSSLTSPMFLNLSSKYMISYKNPWAADNIFCISYRFYNNPAIRKEGEIAAPRKQKKDIFERERKVPYIERLAKSMLRAVPKRSIERYKLMKACSYVYEQLRDEVSVPEFFEEFEMPDTFASWFVVMELHVYILAARVFKRDSVGLHARDMLTDCFWEDVQYRCSRLGDAALAHRKKQLCMLGMQFQAAFYGYDEGVQSNDKVLAAIVWRRFFGFQCDDAEKIERLVKYIRIQLDYLNSLTFEDIVFNQQVLTIPLREVHIG